MTAGISIVSGFLITVAGIVTFVFLMRTAASVDWENKW